MDQTLFFDATTNAISIPSPLPIIIPKLSSFGKPVSDYIIDGFKLVCRVKNSSSQYEWNYENVDTSILFKNHRSWVYLIVVDDIVFKIGETANPLGIKTSWSSIQPKTGSQSRLGRYRKGDATDEDIRISARPYLTAGCKIEFWAKECEIVKSDVIVCGSVCTVEAATQKSQEMAYLNNFINEVGILPMWNKSKK
jgi:hypothetical protein